MGNSKRILIFLAYFFTWISGLIVYFIEKDKEIRKHALQSIIVFLSLTIINYLLMFLSNFVPVFSLLTLIINIIVVILWIYFIIASLIGNVKIFSFLEPIIEKYV